MTKTTKRPLKTTLLVGAALIALPSLAQAAQVSEERSLAAFSEISAHGSTDVEVTIGGSQSVTVYAEDDEMSEIITEVKKGELIIKRKSNKSGIFNRSHSARIVITMPALSDFSTLGSGDAALDGIKADHFELAQHGSGDVTLNGSCETGEFRSNGSGDLDASDFSCGKLDLSSHGSGDMSLEGLKTTTLSYRSQGSGGLDVDGSCVSFEINSMGSGDVDAQGFQCKDVKIDSHGSGEMTVHASGDVSVNINGSGDVDLYGGGKLTHSRTHGSGDVDIHG
jgi:hypothetical protein